MKVLVVASFSLHFYLLIVPHEMLSEVLLSTQSFPRTRFEIITLWISIQKNSVKIPVFIKRVWRVPGSQYAKNLCRYRFPYLQPQPDPLQGGSCNEQQKTNTCQFLNQRIIRPGFPVNVSITNRKILLQQS